MQARMPALMQPHHSQELLYLSQMVAAAWHAPVSKRSFALPDGSPDLCRMPAQQQALLAGISDI